jgi:hypothetical protein
MAVRILLSSVVILLLQGISSRYCYSCVGPEFVLMYDNARAHVARITRAVLRELDIQEMEWPAVSPDLNSIEHM